MCRNPFCQLTHLFLKKWKALPPPAQRHTHSCKTNSDSMMLKVICHVLCSLCGMLSGLGGAGCSEQDHQVITVLCGPHRQQIRLRGSMICSWKSTPLKLKSIHSERLPKDKVPCIREKYPSFCVCVCVGVWASVCYCLLFVSVHASACVFLPFVNWNHGKHVSYFRILRFCMNRQPPCYRGLWDSSPRVWMRLRIWRVIATCWRQFLVSMTLSGSKSKWLQGSMLLLFSACWCLLMILSYWWLTEGAVYHQLFMRNYNYQRNYSSS